MIKDYETFIFDCDGVILNSNGVKSQAFYELTLPYSGAAAKELLRYHLDNGGISRYEKFSYFINNIIKKYEQESDMIPDQAQLIDLYAETVRAGLLSCEISPALSMLRQRLADKAWAVVSGGDQDELRQVFRHRKISEFFNKGIFGSPKNKYEIFERELESGNFKRPAIFFGDSKLDHEVANFFDIDFIFVSGWSDLHNWSEYCLRNKIRVQENLSDLIAETM